MQDAILIVYGESNNARSDFGVFAFYDYRFMMILASVYRVLPLIPDLPVSWEGIHEAFVEY